MCFNSNDFQHIEKTQRTSVDNLVLQVPLKIQVVNLSRSTRKAVTLKMEYF